MCIAALRRQISKLHHKAATNPRFQSHAPRVSSQQRLNTRADNVGTLPAQIRAKSSQQVGCVNLPTMRHPLGRIITSVTIENPVEPFKNIRCDALVDTGASHLVLPKAWMDRLDLNRMQELGVEIA